ncbi:MinD/ParA family protein [Synechococcus sp. RSCCF101]|uniref:MinD/ParA family ATP-binding protein n=1 Tax=Synechococcus sp. RSCCF101 TaxID=2511069 RepID=UPI00124512C3|nr:MinD/ParA family protein [Synechococcus sp. RSCCF101]QEY32511.1 MinD/ParA family protein [Synechococcus sp. RSCCF101]
MTRIIAAHSFRGGTGKSNISANLALALASSGRRVAVLDADLQSPGVHALFNLSADHPGPFLNDALMGRCSMEAAAVDTGRGGPGRLWVVPSSLDPDAIASILREGYEVERLNDGFSSLSEALHLDELVMDTHPGVSEDTLLTAAIADVLLMVMRPDRQDYQGTAVAVEVCRRLFVPDMRMVVNKVPDAFDAGEVRDRVARSYGIPVAAVLPLSQDLFTLASNDLALSCHPDLPWSRQLRELAAELMAAGR